MKDAENVIIMNSETWDAFEKIMFEIASESETPLKYLMGLRSNVELIIDNSIPKGVSELWNKKAYQEYLNGEGK